MSEQKFFRCKHCGNLVGLIHNAEVPLFCCGEPMEALVPNTVEAATEKHIPVVSTKERLVYAEVGSVAHPMTEEHHIEFIYLQTEAGGQMKRLCIDKKADAMFALLNDEAVAVYAYCNLHGLWKADVTAACTHTEDSESEENEISCSSEFSEGCK